MHKWTHIHFIDIMYNTECMNIYLNIWVCIAIGILLTAHKWESNISTNINILWTLESLWIKESSYNCFLSL